MSQMRDEDKIIARDLNKKDISNIPDREFKVMIKGEPGWLSRLRV